MKAGRQHADDVHCPVEHANRLSHSAQITAEVTLAKRMADDRCTPAARHFFFEREQATYHRCRSQNPKELGRHPGRLSILGCRARHDRRLPLGIVGHRLEHRALVVPILEVWHDTCFPSEPGVSLVLSHTEESVTMRSGSR